MYRWVGLRNVQESFVWTVVSCVISSNTNRQIGVQNGCDDHCEETKNLKEVILKCSKMQLAANAPKRRCLCVSITVSDNPRKCGIDTLQFAHVVGIL